MLRREFGFSPLNCGQCPYGNNTFQKWASLTPFWPGAWRGDRSDILRRCFWLCKSLCVGVIEKGKPDIKQENNSNNKATKQIHALSARKSTWTFLPNFSFRIRIFQKYYGLAFAAYFSFLVIMHFEFCLRSRYLRYLQPLQWLGSCQETNWYLSERITWYHIYCSISYIFTRWNIKKRKNTKL